MRAKPVIIIVIVMLAAAALACGSGGDSSGITNAGFKKVCDGEGVEEAAFYGTAGDGAGPYPVVFFRRAGADQAWFIQGKDKLGADFPAEWVSQDGTQTEMVVCLTAIKRELVTECYYTASGEEGEDVELVIEVYTTTYEAVLRNARTAEEYDSTTFVAETDGVCPETAVEFIDQDVRTMDAPPGAALADFLEPWVVE